jgi:hypothetical protein
LPKVDDDKTCRKRVSERNVTKTPPAKVSKPNPPPPPPRLKKKRSHAIERLGKALMNGCVAGKFSVTEVDCVRVAEKIEK